MSKGKGGSHLSPRQLRFLFARGVLGHGTTKSGKRSKAVQYDKERGKAVSAISKASGGKGGATFQRKTAPGAEAMLGGRSNSGLYRGKGHPLPGSGGGGAPPRPDYSATRAQRIAAGYERLARFAGQQSARAHAKALKEAGAPSRKVMASKFPGKFLDTGQRFDAGTTIHYGEGPRGKGAYSRRGSARDMTSLLSGRSNLGNVASITSPGRAHAQRTLFRSAAVTSLGEFAADKGGRERRVGGRLVIDRYVMDGARIMAGKELRAALGKRVRNQSRALVRALREGR